jgi:hypothetical protein
MGIIRGILSLIKKVENSAETLVGAKPAQEAVFKETLPPVEYKKCYKCKRKFMAKGIEAHVRKCKITKVFKK